MNPLTEMISPSQANVFEGARPGALPNRGAVLFGVQYPGCGEGVGTVMPAS
jgi:hypothetical protein